VPGPIPYILSPGTAREALSFYAAVFGGAAELHSFAEFGHADGPADATTLRTWFARLADGRTVVDDLERRAWGAFDGQVIDRYGVRWLIGFEVDAG
jgi:PhnB protein